VNSAGATVRLELLLAAAPSRGAVLSIADRLSGSAMFEASRDRSVELATRRLDEHGLSARDGERLERLATAMLYADPGLCPAGGTAAPAIGSATFDGHPAIPLVGAVVVVEAGAPAATESAARAAHAYWGALAATAPQSSAARRRRRRRESIPSGDLRASARSWTRGPRARGRR
jgi:hypothetical protein